MSEKQVSSLPAGTIFTTRAIKQIGSAVELQEIIPLDGDPTGLPRFIAPVEVRIKINGKDHVLRAEVKIDAHDAREAFTKAPVIIAAAADQLKRAALQPKLITPPPGSVFGTGGGGGLNGRGRLN